MNKRLRRHLGLQVAGFRKRAGLSQEVLADKVGTGPARISRLERGQSNPTVETLASISKALSVPLHELVNFGPAIEDSSAAIQELVLELAGRPEADVKYVHRLAQAAFALLDETNRRK